MVLDVSPQEEIILSEIGRPGKTVEENLVLRIGASDPPLGNSVLLRELSLVANRSLLVRSIAEVRAKSGAYEIPVTVFSLKMNVS